MKRDSGTVCRNIYAFIRLRLGREPSDREIARRWAMEWKSFNGLRHGRRQVPPIAQLEDLAGLLQVDAAFVFEVARGAPAELVHALLVENDPAKLSKLLMPGACALHREAERRDQAYAVEKRRFVRVPVASAARYRARRTDAEARLHNIGRGGLFIHTDADMPVGSRISLEWTLPSQRGQLEAMGEIVWLSSDSTHYPPGIGVEFLDLPESITAAVVRYVARTTRGLSPGGSANVRP